MKNIGWQHGKSKDAETHLGVTIVCTEFETVPLKKVQWCNFIVFYFVVSLRWLSINTSTTQTIGTQQNMKAFGIDKGAFGGRVAQNRVCRVRCNNSTTTTNNNNAKIYENRTFDKVSFFFCTSYWYQVDGSTVQNEASSYRHNTRIHPFWMVNWKTLSKASTQRNNPRNYLIKIRTTICKLGFLLFFANQFISFHLTQYAHMRMTHERKNKKHKT